MIIIPVHRPMYLESPELPGGYARVEGPHVKAFRNYSELLRYIVANCSVHGQSRTVESFYLGVTPGREITPGDLYWANQRISATAMRLSPEQWQRLALVQARARRFGHYLREVEPQWRETGKINYADNSTVSVQVDRAGKRREVVLVGPHGDACF